MAPAVSCCRTPVSGRLPHAIDCSRRWPGRSAARRRTRSKAASSSAARWSNGCAMGWASSGNRPRSRRWRCPCRTAAASTSCRHLPAWARRTGIRTRAAPSSGSREARKPATSPGPPWRASRSRSPTCSKRHETTAGIDLAELRVDGGAAANDYLLQFQADLLGVAVVRPKVTETTALGAAYLAGLAVGFWDSTDALARHWRVDRRFEPSMPSSAAAARRAEWHEALNRSKILDRGESVACAGPTCSSGSRSGTIRGTWSSSAAAPQALASRSMPRAAATTCSSWNSMTSAKALRAGAPSSCTGACATSNRATSPW